MNELPKDIGNTGAQAIDKQASAVRERFVKSVGTDEPRPQTTVTIAAHEESDETRDTLKASAARYYDDLQWRTEDAACGKIDRLLGRPRR